MLRDTAVSKRKAMRRLIRAATAGAIGLAAVGGLAAFAGRRIPCHLLSVRPGPGAALKQLPDLTMCGADNAATLGWRAISGPIGRYREVRTHDSRR
jgi:hypothetical protein